MKYGLALDIDETLSATNVFWMESFSGKFGNPENLSPEQLAEKYTYMQNVPYWQTDEAREWMMVLLHANALQEDIPLIENANHIVNEIHKIVPIVAYITARPISVLSGTKKWLEKHGFPEATIITRPDNVPVDERSRWKANVLHEMYPQVIGIVDDHHELATHLPKEYRGTLFHFATSEKGRDDISIIPCKTWLDVREAVLTLWPKLFLK